MRIGDWGLGIGRLGRRRALTPYFLLFSILALAAALRFYALTASSLWSDEGNTWALMGRSFAQIAKDAAADIHPPGYYWLLKVWTLAWGESALALRSFSAVLGVVLVLLVYAIVQNLVQPSADHPADTRSSQVRDLAGPPQKIQERPAGSRTRLEREKSPIPNPQSPIPLLAALLAALAPFQIYYSQEARMYMLLAVCSAGLVWAVLEGKRQRAKGKRQKGRGGRGWMVSYLLFGVTGLWTHYSFPIILAAVAATHFITLLFPRKSTNQQINKSTPLPFIILNIAILLAFAPWLPTAVERVLNWPAGGDPVGLVEGMRLTLQTLTVGPIRSGPALAWPWLILAGLLPMVGILRHRHNRGVWVIAAWFLAPIGLMFSLGLFSDSFLKFLLAASPAWCVLTALAVSGDGGLGIGDWGLGRFHPFTPSPLHPLTLSLAALILAGVTLPGYYADPAARDNYAGVARYVGVLGDATTDLVLLNAPGQAEVWAYYDPGLPVLALPAQRPPDRAETEAALTASTADRRTIYALFWATEQADPDKIVEGWLDQHAFKGLESWQGNVRFVTYNLPADADNLRCAQPDLSFGSAIHLAQSCISPQPVTGGENTLISLDWQTDAPLDRRYKVTVQLLDSRNQVIAQRDGEPAGGSRPTDGWEMGEFITDNHGLPIPLGTPPGAYRLIAALYDSETGQRLATSAGDMAELGTVQVLASPTDLPLDIVPMQHRADKKLVGDLRLAGYDAYRKDFGHAPKTPVMAGDRVHVTLFWRMAGGNDVPVDQQFTLSLGDQTVTAPLAGGSFPTDPATWSDGILVRGEFDIPFSGGDRALTLHVGETRVRLGQIP